jgi:hypothetical protein
LLGPEGIDIVGGKVAAAGVQVIAGGLGNSSSIDMPALQPSWTSSPMKATPATTPKQYLKRRCSTEATAGASMLSDS